MEQLSVRQLGSKTIEMTNCYLGFYSGGRSLSVEAQRVKVERTSSIALKLWPANCLNVHHFARRSPKDEVGTNWLNG